MHAHLVAAFLALENRNLDSAAREIQLADAIGPARPAMKLWQVDLAARLALLRDEAPQALTLYEEETKLARNSGARPESWRGLLGQAQALSLLKRKSAAVKVLEQAEQVLDETLLRVPLAEGRGRFLTDRESTSRKLVALYLDLRRPRDAYRAARRARARVLRAAARVDRIAELAPSQAQKWKRAVGRYLRARTALERESAGDWELPADRLAAMQQARRARTQEIEAALDEAYALVPQGQASQETPPAPGSVRLLYFPRDSGWVGFCETPSGLSVARIASPLPKSPVALAQSLLSPFHEQLEGAEALVFYPYGALASVDFHGLPWNGHLLVDELRVSYGLDLGRDEGGADSRQSVLIVADPSGDLPHARQEGRRVEAAFGAPRATVLEGPAATRADVLERLPHAGLFHYAGHGTFAGPTGGESSLALASGAEVRVGDILALSRVPRFVVLSACEAARTDRGARPESLGVAQAFVTRGAEAVIAPTRPVADDLAAALMRELYAHPAEDLVTSLTRAQRTLDKARPDSDWAAYRVLVP